VVYYLGAEAFLIDRSVADITRGWAVGIGVVTLILGWLIYDGLYASDFGQRHGMIAAAIAFAGLIGVAFGLTHILSARAAYVHVGALIGIIMVANVWIRIIPAQSDMVAARKAGTEPDGELGLRAKQRSVHNNYMTLPIVFVMISGHYPMTYGHPYSWLVLIAMFVIGAVVRHWFNLRNAGTPAVWPIPVAVAAMVALAAVVSLPGLSARSGAKGEAVPFQRVREIVTARCTICHSAQPRFEGIDTAPKGIRFDSAAEIRAHAAQIRATAVAATTMPLGNATNITAAERTLLGRWIDQGARIE